MRTTIFTAVFLFGFTMVALPARLRLTDQSSAPGASVAIPVQFLSEGAAISALQFDIECVGSAIELNTTLGDPARSSFKILYIADLAASKKRVLIAGWNKTAITDGTLVNFFGSVDPSTPGGTYVLQLSNLVATDGSGTEVEMTGTNGSLTIQGTTRDAVPLQPQGVLNAASLVPGAIAPGEFVTLIGAAIGPSPRPNASSTTTKPLGASVLIDGTPAPLVYTSPNQINLVVPFEVDGKSAANLEIIDQGQTIVTLPVAVRPAAPAIFTQSATGVGPGAILNQDSTLNSLSNPASRGSVVAIYATGAGQTNPPGVDGEIAGAVLAKPLLHVSVQIGGVDAEVLYAGAAPGLIAGTLQVNVQVPQGAPVGPAIPVRLTAGQAGSPVGVTLSIK